MKDNNVYYKKDNGRYEPFGIYGMYDYLPDGIWYVKHGSHSRSITSFSYLENIYKVGDAKQIDIPEICGMANLAQEVMENDSMQELLAETFTSYQDVIAKTISILVQKSKKLKDAEEIGKDFDI